MGKETKVGLLVGMCFIVCCAIVLSHHGRRRVEAQNLSVTNAERSHEAPLPLDRSKSAERATERLTPKRRQPRDERRSAEERGSDTEPDTRFARNTDAKRNGWSGSGVPRFGFSPARSGEPASRASGNADGPFIHRGPAIPGVARPEPSTTDRKVGFDIIVLDDDPDDADPLVANVPSRNRSTTSTSNLHKLTSTPSPKATDAEAKRAEQTRSANRGIAKEQKPAKQDRPAAMDRHIVQEGERLAKIARQYYGSSDPRILNEIVKANSKTMSSPDHIVVGQELLLPEIIGVEPEAPEEFQIDRADDRQDILAEYEVQPGDLLSRIVSRHYGVASKANIDAVYNANRDRMQSPDRLEAGITLRLPAIVQTESKNRRLDERKDAPQDSTPRQRPTDSPKSDSPKSGSDGGFRWYRVKKGDVFSTIAAAEMGTSRRWRELAEFNSDIFPNPKHIRHGVRIRIPTTVTSAAAPGSTRGNQ